MTRRSAPRPRRWEAKEWRREWGLIFRATAVLRMYLRTIRSTDRVVSRPPR